MPLVTVLRRGSVFLFHQYDQLDDPALAGRTKPKFVVVLSNSAADDPLVYLLATSEKPKHAGLPFMFRIKAGTYPFFPVDTLLPIATAGDAEIDREKFHALYERGAIAYMGRLGEAHVQEILMAIDACPTVTKRFKKTLSPPPI